MATSTRHTVPAQASKGLIHARRDQCLHQGVQYAPEVVEPEPGLALTVARPRPLLGHEQRVGDLDRVCDL
ncbi:hypothetical protein [Actinomyces faecalis]|uniref:hypothetical protein n=1 Tax=Actinomyces faecalis TaxID=2722820 RepID=UPI0015530E38|nr:hypothetical protein [Actinomyces faecalis]